MVFFSGVCPVVLLHKKASSTQLANDWSLHYRSRRVGVARSTVPLRLEARGMWNLGPGNLSNQCVFRLFLNKIQALADMNALGRFLLEVAQEDCDDLNLLCTH